MYRATDILDRLERIEERFSTNSRVIETLRAKVLPTGDDCSCQPDGKPSVPEATGCAQRWSLADINGDDLREDVLAAVGYARRAFGSDGNHRLGVNRVKQTPPACNETPEARLDRQPLQPIETEVCERNPIANGNIPPPIGIGINEGKRFIRRRGTCLRRCCDRRASRNHFHE